MRFSAFSFLAFVAALLLLSACEMAIDNSETSSAPPGPGIPVAQLFNAEAGLTPRQRFRKAISLLEAGEAAHARVELNAYLLEVPKSKLAAGLLSQIDADPVAVLGSDSVNYTLKQGESLSIVAGRFLGDKMKFYLLARYNNMENPSSVAAGTVIRVPRRVQTANLPTKSNGSRPSKGMPKRVDNPPVPGRKTAVPPKAPKSATPSPTPPTGPVIATPKPPEPSPPLPPPVPVVTDADLIKDLIGQGRELSVSGDHNGAVNHLEEGLIQFPDDRRVTRSLTVAYLSRAEQLAGQGDYDQAVSALERARELDPKNGKVKKNLALMVDKRRAKEIELAEQQKRAADQKRADALYQVAVNYRKANAPIDALQATKAALKVWPQHDGARRELATLKPVVGKFYYQEGMTAMTRQKLVEAIAFFDKGLEIDPENDVIKRERTRALNLCDQIRKLTNSATCAGKK